MSASEKHDRSRRLFKLLVDHPGLSPAELFDISYPSDKWTRHIVGTTVVTWFNKGYCTKKIGTCEYTAAQDDLPAWKDIIETRVNNILKTQQRKAETSVAAVRTDVAPWLRV